MAQSDTYKLDPAFVKKAMAAPLLEKGEEQDLARAWRDKRDHRALEKLVGAHIRLAISMASKFRHYGLPLHDLVQEGSMGLLEAADRFDPELDIRFSTYAGWWIRSYIQDYILRNWSIVRTGTTAAQKKLFFSLKRVRSRLSHGSSADTAAPLTAADRQKVAEVLGVREQDVTYMEGRLSAADHSANAPLGEDSTEEWQNLLTDDRATPEEATSDHLDGNKRRNWLMSALSGLTDREQLIIRRRQLADEGETLADLGSELGISKERVRQIEHQALQKLRKALIRLAGDPGRARTLALG